MSTVSLIRSDARAAGITSPRALVLSLVGASPFWVVVLYRVGHALQARGVPVLSHGLRALGLVVWGADIWPTATIGPSFRIAHPQGIVVGSAVVAGSDLHLFPGSVLGGSARLRREWGSNQPRLGDRVLVASHAVVAGGIRVGDDVVIGANAVVLDDIADNSSVKAPEPVVERRQGPAGGPAPST
jgi:serine O-acetyltransferase